MAFIPFSISFHTKRSVKFGNRDGKSPKGWLFWEPGLVGRSIINTKITAQGKELYSALKYSLLVPSWYDTYVKTFR
jgi:hypothetical protein